MMEMLSVILVLVPPDVFDIDLGLFVGFGPGNAKTVPMF